MMNLFCLVILPSIAGFVLGEIITQEHQSSMGIETPVGNLIKKTKGL